MRRHILISLGLLLLLAIGTIIWLLTPDRAQLSELAVTGRVPQLSVPREQTIPTVDVAKAVGWKQGETPTPAAGLKVAAFARGLDHPRWLYALPNGDVLVAETNSPPRKDGGIKGWVRKKLMHRAGADVPSANRITLLRDTTGDGKADQRSVLLSGLNSPFGMALVGDWLYVADTDALLRFPYKPGETRISAKPEKIIDLPGGGDHWTRNILPDPADGTLWVTIGSSTNLADNGMAAERGRARIIKVDPKTKTARVFATGLRNPNGLAVNPDSGRLWTVVNARDMMGSDMPPDYLTEVNFGNFYGWPWYFWGGYKDPRIDSVGPDGEDMRQYVARPDYALGAHTAPLGLTFAAGTDLGKRFSRGAFIGEHGSWNRVPPSGYKVVFVPFSANGFPAKATKPINVLTGFLDKNGDARGRPAGVIAGPKGALLVADDVGNIVWRVTATKSNSDAREAAQSAGE
ncbi:PQQ-dependent sugar dehydrogenase [Stakelama marina]|uniref:Sorbosone dehydrogenase family protein n=1 Tax=Stakelama marina TaxID=2826939 RepID=A0A8T4II58_9SPHN|nr:sorbosone dehydrogenase family protein [Stakelama marina]MBR0553564.1 sorbosone dehydrogenase family protein [Stakelama marina]